MTSPPYIPVREIPRALGVLPGMTILVASDLTRLSVQAIRHEGGFSADVLISSFLEALGPGGTIIIPAFNYNLKNGEEFDLKKTIPITGALAQAALLRPDFRRTRHALHSFLVWGRYASALAQMDNRSSFGPDSPFGFFRDKDATMLMVGTNVPEAFTFVHYVEELFKVRYRRYQKVRVSYVDGEGTSGVKEFMIYSKKPGWTMEMGPLEELFRGRGFLTERSVNHVRCQQISLAAAFLVIKDDILLNRARSISRFSPGLFVRETLKNTLSALNLYQSLSEKIAHAPRIY